MTELILAAGMWKSSGRVSVPQGPSAVSLGKGSGNPHCQTEYGGEEPVPPSHTLPLCSSMVIQEETPPEQCWEWAGAHAPLLLSADY